MDSLTLWIIAIIIVLILFYVLRHLLKIVIIIALVIFAATFVIDKLTIKPAYHPEELDFIKLPLGFKITTFADNLGGSSVSIPGPNPGPRLMTFYQDTVYVALPSQGKIIALEDKDQDGTVETQKTFIEGLSKPHSIDFYQDAAYIAEEDKITKVKDLDHDNKAEIKTKETLLTLPSGSHWTKTAHIFNGQLYVTSGSSCNACAEEDKMRAALTRCDLQGKNCITYASGLRNTVDFIQHNGIIYGTDNGRDLLGNNLPPDEVNILKEGKNYGWPTCYGNKIHDTDYDKNTYIRDPCLDTEAPLVELPSHVAPLGLTIYDGTTFPSDYKGNMFIAYHGSWNSEQPVGYKVVAVNLKEKTIRDFATGWLDERTIKGRPVGIINFRNGLLISDDNAGKIYKIMYDNE